MKSGSLVYDGTEKKPFSFKLVSGTNNETTLIEGTDYTITYEDNINAGTAKATIKGIGPSFTGSAVLEFQIEKATPSYTITSATGLVYTAAAQQLITAATTSQGTLEFSLDKTTWTTDFASMTGTDAGTHPVYYRITYTDPDIAKNYKTVNAQRGVTIAKFTPIVTITPATPTYNGSAQALISSASATWISGSATIYYSLDNSTWSTSYPTGTNAGSYTVYYKVNGDANHNEVTGTVNPSIAKATPTLTLDPSSQVNPIWNTSLPWIASSNWTYTGDYAGDPQESHSWLPGCTVIATGGTITIVKGADPVPSGSVTITFPATTNYNSVSATFTVSAS